MRHVLAQLADDVEILEASNAEAARRVAADEADIDLVLLDLMLPDDDGFVALEAFAGTHPLLPIVVLSASESREDMQRALDAGAMGYVPKSSTVPVMLNALRLVLAGGLYVPPALVGGRSAEAAVEAAQPALTPRQLEVLARVVEGKSNKTIASELGMAVATVKAHVTSVFKTLKVSNRTQAALAAERLGLRRQ